MQESFTAFLGLQVELVCLSVVNCYWSDFSEALSDSEADIDEAAGAVLVEEADAGLD